MNAVRRRVVILIVAAVVLAIVALRQRSDGGARGGGPAQAAALREGAAAHRRDTSHGGQAASAALDSSAVAAAHRALHALGQRTLVPRPEASKPGGDAAPPPHLQRGHELNDRRGLPRSPADDEMRELLKANMEAVEDDVEECLRAWSEVDPDIHGKVSLAFQLDQSGLGKVWILDWEQVPQGPLSCFASAVYRVDWSHISDRPIEISNHFVVEKGEAAQVDVRGPKAQ